MGQRLNIEIRRKKDNKILANSYYHWYAYTYTSLELADEIMENIYGVIINDKVSDDANIIFGTVIDESLQDEVEVTVVATGVEE